MIHPLAVRVIALATVVAAAAACGPSRGDGDDDGCTPACSINGWRECRGGELQPPVPCVGGDVCVEGLGCAACVPGFDACDGQDVRRCNADGTLGDVVQTCGADQVCAGGTCVTACERAAADRSNIGCEYWAVDLDNEYSQFNDAAREQFAVALANASDHVVDVIVERNDAEPGAPHQLATVRTAQINPSSLIVIELPQREVDGSVNGMNEGPGTMLSSRAYRIRTSYPVVAYQFNPIVQSFSNGASLLIPTSGLDDDYFVLGWPTANPIAGPFPIPGIPDHSFVTVVGVGDAPVTVQVVLGGPIVGGGGIPATPAGGTVTATLHAFDVLNLESTGIPGDLSGTRVTANGPVAVFSGGERAIVPGAVRPPAPAGFESGDLCCTEHFEQQVFPRSSLGKAFVTTRSPIRSTSATNPEADVWRVMATEPGTVVTTSLPPPYDRFELDAGRWAEFWSQRDFVVTSNQPIMVAQYLVSQGYVEAPAVGGDPEFILYPPAEQYRTDYIFLVPPTFQRDYAVISAPAAAVVTLDGAVIGEQSPRCSRHDAGTLEGVAYVALRCELDDGVHYVSSDLPVGVTVYGYYNVGSYGYAAGAELKRINID